LSNSSTIISKYPFWQAIYKGDLPSSLHLLTINTDVSKCRDDGKSPLYIACQNGYLDIVVELIDKNINTDVNKCGDDGVQEY
jgi:ankyrin repeat protein